MADRVVKWLEIQNWWPIMIAIIGVTLYMANGFSSMDKRLSLLEQRLDTKLETIITYQVEDNRQNAQVSRDLGGHEKRISNLEFLAGLAER